LIGSPPLPLPPAAAAAADSIRRLAVGNGEEYDCAADLLGERGSGIIGCGSGAAAALLVAEEDTAPT
jgi:hypothetical protein